MKKMYMNRKRNTLGVFVLFLLQLFLLTGCYSEKTKEHAAFVSNDPSEKSLSVMDSAYLQRQRDSLTFSSTHHYSRNYNFVVKVDSFFLLRQQPEEAVSQMSIDSLVVRRNDRLVVVDIRILPQDMEDSVWVQLARDQLTFGWTHETELLKKVVPDDPISQFISTFSDRHLIFFLVIISLMLLAYLMRIVMKEKAKIVHFNDIDSVYPTIMALLMASTATLYASIQMFAPEMWHHFYFYPTLNPFGTPLLLSVFLVCVWGLLILTVACVDVVTQRLPVGEALLYLCGLVAVCAFNYILFSITTLYYIGYLLLVAYFYVAIRHYFRHSHCRYVCGNCGAMLRRKGKCPYCGTVNS